MQNKKTPISTIPRDWEVSELQLVSNIVDSLHQTPKFSNEGFAMVRVTDIKPGNLDLNTTLRVNEANYNIFTKNYHPKKDDIVLSRVGSYGISSYVNTDEPFCMGQNTVVIEPNINNRYLYYTLNSTSIRRQIEFESFGTGYKSLSLENIKELLIPLPQNKKEQAAIAQALSDTDELISSLEKLIEKKRLIKQGTVQQLLNGKKRLPGFSGKWEVKKLGEIAFINMGQSPSSKYYNAEEEGIPLIQGNADIKNRKSIKRVWTTQITKVCEKDDLIITVRAPVGIIGRATGFSCIGRGVCSLKINCVDKNFLYHLLIFKEDNWKILEQGSTFTAANSEQIFDFELFVPIEESEQIEIANILNIMDNELEALQKKLGKYKMLKQGMMQVLLTGKIRLVEPTSKEI